MAECDDLDRGREHELARVQHERLSVGYLYGDCQVVLLHRRVDVGVQVVVEHPEPAVQPHVDARRLHQRRLERVQLQLTLLDLGDEVAVGEQHSWRVRRPDPSVVTRWGSSTDLEHMFDSM
jgi:hypothetical protein